LASGRLPQEEQPGDGRAAASFRAWLTNKRWYKETSQRVDDGIPLTVFHSSKKLPRAISAGSIVGSSRQGDPLRLAFLFFQQSSVIWHPSRAGFMV
jgi:hypothetical protein